MPGKTENPIDNLVNWAVKNGAKLPNFRLQDRTIYTDIPLKSGDLICFIPEKILFSVSVCSKTALGKKIYEIFKDHELTDNNKYPHSLDLIIMATYLAYNRTNKGSFFFPYFASLPQEYDLPICWPLDVINSLLRGTNLHFMTLKKLEWIDGLLNVMSDNQIAITKSDFIWGLATISSRAFPKSTCTIDPNLLNDWISISEICLYPLLDMFNHNPDCKLTWKMDNNGVSFEASMDMIGEVFNNYGPKGNENLLGNYGFVLENNEYDYVKLCLNTTESDFQGKRLEILKKNSLSQFLMLFESDTELSDTFWGVGRIMTSSYVELGQYKKGITSKKLDIICLDTLYKLIDAKRLEIGELQEIENVNQTWVELASVYRRGQRRTFNHYLKLIKSNLENLLAQVSFLNFEYEVGDEFGGTVNGIISKLNDGDELFKQFYDKYDANTCKQILGKEYCEFKEFHTDFGGDKRQALWGFTMSLLILKSSDTIELSQSAGAALAAEFLLAKSMIFLLLAPHFLSQAQLCQRQAEFSACSTKAATQISICSSEVSGAVTSSLYGCLCEQNKAMLDCYELCLDDPQLVMQKESQMQNVNAACAVTVISTSTSILSTSASTQPMTRTTFGTSIATFISTGTEATKTPPKPEGPRRTISAIATRTQPAGVVLDSDERISVASYSLGLLISFALL